MAKVTVYRFRCWNTAKWDAEVSPRYATREGVPRNCEIMEDTAVEIDESHLDGNGMTEPGFVPSGTARNS